MQRLHGESEAQLSAWVEHLFRDYLEYTHFKEITREGLAAVDPPKKNGRLLKGSFAVGLKRPRQKSEKRRERNTKKRKGRGGS